MQTYFVRCKISDKIEFYNDTNITLEHYNKSLQIRRVENQSLKSPF